MGSFYVRGMALEPVGLDYEPGDRERFPRDQLVFWAPSLPLVSLLFSCRCIVSELSCVSLCTLYTYPPGCIGGSGCSIRTAVIDAPARKTSLAYRLSVQVLWPVVELDTQRHPGG
jgi:hypothetical protein